MLQYNLYTYCVNDLVSLSDQNGYGFFIALAVNFGINFGHALLTAAVTGEKMTGEISLIY